VSTRYDVTQQQKEEEDEEGEREGPPPTPIIGQNNALSSVESTESAGESDHAVSGQTTCHIDEAQQRQRGIGETQEGVRASDGLRRENSIAVSSESTTIHRTDNATPVPVVGELGDGVGVRIGGREEGQSYIQWVFMLWFTLLVLTTTAIWTIIIVYSYTPLDNSTDKHNTIISSIDIDTLRSVALAPFGAILRYSLWNVPHITPYVTKNIPSMKVPTLTANVLGTLFLALSSSIAVSGSNALYTSAFNQGQHTNRYLEHHALTDKSHI
jgi:hypothetical protein